MQICQEFRTTTSIGCEACSGSMADYAFGSSALRAFACHPMPAYVGKKLLMAFVPMTPGEFPFFGLACQHDINGVRWIAPSSRLTGRARFLWSRRSVRRGCSSRGIAWAGRDAASRAFAPMHANSREASETGPPPLRADASSSQAVRPSCFIPRRTEAQNRRGGAPKGERPTSLDARRIAERGNARLMCLRAFVIGPRTGAAAPERLSALRFPRMTRGRNWQSSEEALPRENEDACAMIRMTPVSCGPRLC